MNHMGNMLVSVILILAMLLLSAFFSGMEIAFVSKNRLKLEIDRRQNRVLDFIADIFERHSGQYITSILVGNNIALVVYSLYMSALLRSLAALAGWDAVAEGGSVLAETLISTVIIIYVAEFLPKSIVKGNPNREYDVIRLRRDSNLYGFQDTEDQSFMDKLFQQSPGFKMANHVF